jgi:hypothetical protein
VRRTPVHDRFDDDHDEPSRVAPPTARRVSSTPTAEPTVRRGEIRHIRASRQVVTRRGPDPKVWFVRASIGIAALAGLWLGLQAVFPLSESRVKEAPTPTLAVDASTVGAPEPPSAVQVAPPAVVQPAPPAPEQAAPAVEGDRLPGLPTPAPVQLTPVAATQVAAVQPAPPQPASPPAATEPPALVAAAEPSAAPAEAPAQAEAPAPATAEQPAQDDQTAGPAAKPTAAPIPPPEPAVAAAQPPAVAAAPPPPAPAPVRQAPPAAVPSSGGPFELAASASPANPISEQAQVTISVRATQGGAPVAGAFCMATVHYRTATARQPNGGFTTNASGVGSFVLDARGTTYGFNIPVDVTCSTRSGTVTARTGFTPTKGR